MFSTVSSFVSQSKINNALKCLAKTVDWFNKKLVDLVEGEEVQSNDGSFVEVEENVYNYDVTDNNEPEREIVFTNGSIIPVAKATTITTQELLYCAPRISMPVQYLAPKIVPNTTTTTTMTTTKTTTMKLNDLNNTGDLETVDAIEDDFNLHSDCCSLLSICSEVEFNFEPLSDESDILSTLELSFTEADNDEDFDSILSSSCYELTPSPSYLADELDFDVLSDIDSELSFDADHALSFSTGFYPSTDPLSYHFDEDNNYATDELQTSIEDQSNNSVITADIPSAFEITEYVPKNTSNIIY
ncbi:unnamed protein product [Ambrosiozyma monospora]|uniref:Unnamed protein product n=1 Tax=Ambrosiozyma monospora TaxID=43982 RepID=A0A9W6YW91_AMBMO|nr:unnamed protein product [Ambrosiozyma monospora]